MAAYTTNYRLHQWEPEDHFLRTDFNEDFAKLDTAIKGVSTAAASQAAAADAKAQRALNALEPLGYNLYHLMVQNYYDGKVTGNKKALLFDGFLDESLVSGKTAALEISHRRLTLWGTAAGTLGHADLNAYNNSTYVSMNPTTPSWTVDREMSVNKFTFMLSCDGSCTGPVDIILNNGMVQTATYTGSSWSGFQRVSVTFTPVKVKAGDTLRATFHKASGASPGVRLDGNLQVAGYFSFQSSYANSGTLTVKPQTLAAAPASARAWVRHSGGSVTLTLNGTAMTAAGTRSTVNADGTACTESAFRLDKALTARVSPVLTVNGGGAPATYVYDYGIMFF